MSIAAEDIIGSQKGVIRNLEKGERLGQPEFHARYEAMPPGFKAELIGGVVTMPSPMKRPHSKIQTVVIDWLREFERLSKGVEALSGPSVLLDDRSEPEPDALLRILPSYGGLTRDIDDYVTGSPELVIEVSASTVAFDLGEKKVAYEGAGIPEYLVLLAGKRQVRWFSLEDGRYVELQPDENGVFHSRVFPGLRLLPDALFNDYKRPLRRTLREGIASAEHKEWVRGLASTARSKQKAE